MRPLWGRVCVREWRHFCVCVLSRRMHCMVFGELPTYSVKSVYECAYSPVSKRAKRANAERPPRACAPVPRVDPTNTSVQHR